MIRQITPAAKSEIAIGMNTAVLKATDQATRSVSTAKIRPMGMTAAVTAGTRADIGNMSMAASRVRVVPSRRWIRSTMGVASSEPAAKVVRRRP